MLRTTKQKTDYLAGIYARVSKEDERHGESLSIENQLIIIRNYIKESGFSEVKIYVDEFVWKPGIEIPKTITKEEIEAAYFVKHR